MNPQQQLAVKTTDVPLIINAGPGTGKTRTLISKVLYLIQKQQVNSESILTITFTRRAAAEITERLHAVTDIVPFVSTFHGLGYLVLQKVSGEDELNLISDRRREEVIREIAGPKAKMRDLSLSISRKKNNLHAEVDEITEKYNQKLKELGLLDFDDLLLEGYRLLKSGHSELHDRFKYILVDEFQDTNDIQYELIKLLAGREGRGLFVIGDPLQSIYSFRGANAEIFNRMKNDFPHCKEISLPINYRSGEHIIHVSAKLFPETPPLQAHTTSPGTVRLVETFDEYTEADLVVREVCAAVGGTDLLQAADLVHTGEHVRFSDIAVVYRTHALSRMLADRFVESGIPYQVIGEGSPYEKKDIRTIIVCLKYMVEKDEALKQEVPPLFLQSLPAAGKVSEVINTVVTVCGIEPSRDLNQFRSSMLRFDEYEDGLQKAVEYIKFLEDHEFYDPAGDKVTLLTMHAAKGLEFKYVFICGFEEGSIPHKRGKEVEDPEEEKRLFYVAMTRAKQHLTILYARERNRKKTQISRFKELITCAELEEAKDDMTEKIEKKREKEKIKKSQMKLF